MLADQQFATQPKIFSQPARKLVFVGSVEQLYKAPEILIAAFARLAKNDPNYHLTMLGAGRNLSMLISLAERLGITEQISFVGEVSSKQVMDYLHASDVFVLPSRTEGLPRAMIEAMAAGLPCVGSNAGGIPELLAPDFCADAGDSTQLYNILSTLCNDVTRLNQQATRNLAKAKDYRMAELTNRRNEFLSHHRRAKRNNKLPLQPKFSIMIKRLFDIICSAIILVLSLPILMSCALALYLTGCRPVLFKQPRPGLHGKVFNMYKFRSMNNNCDANGNLLPDSERLTKLGHFIRKTSIDELPGLICVLKGGNEFSWAKTVIS